MTDIAELIKTTGMVPVFNHSDLSVAKRVVKACYDEGLRVFEWTNRGEGAFKVFTELAGYVQAEMPDMIMGAGSVFNGNMARKYVAKGARFIVSPILDPELAETCKQLEVLWIPGTGTATEIHQADKWGAEIIKVFPGTAAGGPGFIKAVLAPMPWVQLMPTGGVDTSVDNIKAWFEAGVCCVGMGSKLFTKELVENEDPKKLISIIKETLSIIQDLRFNTKNS